MVFITDSLWQGNPSRIEQANAVVDVCGRKGRAGEQEEHDDDMDDQEPPKKRPACKKPGAGELGDVEGGKAKPQPQKIPQTRPRPKLPQASTLMRRWRRHPKFLKRNPRHQKARQSLPPKSQRPPPTKPARRQRSPPKKAARRPRALPKKAARRQRARRRRRTLQPRAAVRPKQLETKPRRKGIAMGMMIKALHDVPSPSKKKLWPTGQA